MSFGAIFLFLIVWFTPVVLNAQQNSVVNIDPLSGTSLLLETRLGNLPLSNATGFIVESRSKRYLISNTHVFSGIEPFSKKPFDQKGRVPDQIRIWHHQNKLGNWTGPIEKLRNDDGSARWIQPNDKIDVAALPITVVPEGVRIYPFDLKLADADVLAMVGMPAFVIGYPAGLSSTGISRLQEALKLGIHAPGFPIWKTGHIATDPDIDYDGLPVSLIDATTCGGMSGSPVVVRLTGPYFDKKRNSIMKVGVPFKLAIAPVRRSNFAVP